MDTGAGLDAGLFIGGDDPFIVPEPLILPHPLAQIENPTGFHGKGRVAREDPAAVAPRSDRVLMEPAPEGAPADLSDQA